MHAEAMKELGNMSAMPCLGFKLLKKSKIKKFLLGEGENNEKEVRNGVMQCYIWIMMLVTGRFNQHVVPSPVLARLYMLMDEGLADYISTLVVRTTPFPSPFSQIINTGLHLYNILVPLAVVSTGSVVENETTCKANQGQIIYNGFLN